MTKTNTRVLIFANCQGENYKLILDSMRSDKTVETEHILTYKNLDNFDFIRDRVQHADVLIIQPIKSYPLFTVENLKKYCKPDCLVLKVPFLKFYGFWPKVKNKLTSNFDEKAVMFFPDFNEDESIDKYLSGSFYTSDEIDQHFSKCMEDFKAAQLESDIHFLKYFLDNYKEYPLFNDPYHPTWPFLKWVSNEISKKINSVKGRIFKTSDLLEFNSVVEKGYFTPISKDVMKLLSLEFDEKSYFLFDSRSYLNAVYEHSLNGDAKLIKNFKERNKMIQDKEQMKIVVVTPCFNSLQTIEATIQSVLNQFCQLHVRYHIQDGGSTDGTIEFLEDLQKRISDGKYPVNLKSFEFTFKSERDDGMYDAINRGFSSAATSDDNWLTWINSDDTLEHDCLKTIAHVSASIGCEDVEWISGKTSVREYDGTYTRFFLKSNSYVLSNGLADGFHWNFLQQEGTFFKRRLFTETVIRQFVSCKYAGDWCLWRLFARKAKLYQIDRVLANFHKVKGQLSEVNREAYVAETNLVVPPPRRYRSLICDDFDLEYYCLENQGDDTYKILTKSLSESRKMWLDKFNVKALKGNLLQLGNIIAYDNEWQYPAITEKHAFKRMLNYRLDTISDSVYVAFPWATLIDLENNKKERSAALKDILQEVRLLTQGHKKVFTVCQHILMMKFQSFFNEAGITDIFWSHCVKKQKTLTEYKNVRVHPFPLFPVQICKSKNNERNILFSFVGARSNPWYLTNIRELIIEKLQGEKDALIISRDQWHYEKVVYEKQISGSDKTSASLIDDNASTQFKDILANSIFTLCPSGSGPNSIRLWEAIESGSIPVILAETLALPGDSELWHKSVVFCNENELDLMALPNRLREIAKNNETLEEMRKGLKQLALLYGEQNFVTDIVSKFKNPSYNRFLQLTDFQELFKIGVGGNNDDFIILSYISRLILDPSYIDFFYQHAAFREFTRSYIDNKGKHSENLLQAIRIKGYND